MRNIAGLALGVVGAIRRYRAVRIDCAEEISGFVGGRKGDDAGTIAIPQAANGLNFDGVSLELRFDLFK